MRYSLLKVLVVALVGSPICGCSQATDEGSPYEGVRLYTKIVLPDGDILEGRSFVEGIPAPDDLPDLIAASDGDFVCEFVAVIDGLELSGKIEGVLDDGGLSGLLKSYTLIEGHWVLNMESMYEDGLRDGKTIVYYPESGLIQAEGFWSNGVRDGPFTAYYPSGKVSAKIAYDEGELNGFAEVFDRSGNLLASGEYVDGEKGVGTFVEDIMRFIRESFSLEGGEP